MKTDYFKIPHNKHLGKKPKDWYVPKHSKEKKQDFSIYGRNKRGKKALCDTCTKNNWYCPVRPRYYQCKSYIKK